MTSSKPVRLWVAARDRLEAILKWVRTQERVGLDGFELVTNENGRVAEGLTVIYHIRVSILAEELWRCGVQGTVANACGGECPGGGCGGEQAAVHVGSRRNTESEAFGIELPEMNIEFLLSDPTHEHRGRVDLQLSTEDGVGFAKAWMEFGSDGLFRSGSDGRMGELYGWMDAVCCLLVLRSAPAGWESEYSVGDSDNSKEYSGSDGSAEEHELDSSDECACDGDLCDCDGVDSVGQPWMESCAPAGFLIHNLSKLHRLDNVEKLGWKNIGAPEGSPVYDTLALAKLHHSSSDSADDVVSAGLAGDVPVDDLSEYGFPPFIGGEFNASEYGGSDGDSEEHEHELGSDSAGEPILEDEPFDGNKRTCIEGASQRIQNLFEPTEAAKQFKSLPADVRLRGRKLHAVASGSPDFSGPDGYVHRFGQSKKPVLGSMSEWAWGRAALDALSGVYVHLVSVTGSDIGIAGHTFIRGFGMTLVSIAQKLEAELWEQWLWGNAPRKLSEVLESGDTYLMTWDWDCNHGLEETAGQWKWFSDSLELLALGKVSESLTTLCKLLKLQVVEADFWHESTEFTVTEAGFLHVMTKLAEHHMERFEQTLPSGKQACVHVTELWPTLNRLNPTVGSGGSISAWQKRSGKLSGERHLAYHICKPAAEQVHLRVDSEGNLIPDQSKAVDFYAGPLGVSFGEPAEEEPIVESEQELPSEVAALDESLCPTCQHNEAGPADEPCGFDEEVHGDITYCRCCEQCRELCHDEI